MISKRRVTHILPQSSMGHNKYRTFQTGLSYKIMTDFQSFNQRGLELKGHNKMRLGLDFKAADTHLLVTGKAQLAHKAHQLTDSSYFTPTQPCRVYQTSKTSETQSLHVTLWSQKVRPDHLTHNDISTSGLSFYNYTRMQGYLSIRMYTEICLGDAPFIQCINK